ncbi:sn-glycerol-3-phosphate ABC transporter permease UgpE [Nitratireductor sp. B36]|uniref:sn-glycerol-3-phosphate ABC transporter permease UgpE n=1 Tax=Nitratireductor sp. B36 TaxID=2762059 RepID=UPI001E4C7D7D|nr:sn-glycerol-3-phosphate ABC transporter permease UgpE [Nitratireductor sp. B36]MCC5781309.1 sn-glycerol-3-phosphate ABC transporter permease UgpE [Nitratireductor sp. B36]
MVEKQGFGTILMHAVLIIGIAIVCFPIYLTFVGSTLTHFEIIRPPMPLVPGPHFIDNYSEALTAGITAPVGRMLLNSFVMAMGIAIGKIAISILSAYAIVYFRFPFRMFAFWAIFMTLMLPVEVRIVPTYEVVASLGMLNSYTGLILPLIASATATFLFRQFFMTVPDELVEAARVDGAGPLRFFKDILLPLSVTNIAALFVILFIYGWNQFLWPLLITTKPEMNTIVMGLKQMMPTADDYGNWPVTMAAATLAVLPPVAVVIFMQRLFVKGLVETEK